MGSVLWVEDIDCYYCLLGWKCCGYYYVIFIDGMIEVGCLEELVGVYCKYYNSYSIGICYIGGLDDGGIMLKDIWMEV